MQTRPRGKSFLRVLFFALMAALGLTSLVPTAEAANLRFAWWQFKSVTSSTLGQACYDNRTQILVDAGVDVAAGMSLCDKQISSKVESSNGYLMELEFPNKNAMLGSERSRQFMVSTNRFVGVEAGLSGKMNTPTSNSTFLWKYLTDNAQKEWVVVSGEIAKGGKGKEYNYIDKFPGNFPSVYKSITNEHSNAAVVMGFYTILTNDTYASTKIDDVFTKGCNLTCLRNGETDGHWLFCSDAALASVATVTPQNWNYSTFACTVDFPYVGIYTVRFVDGDGTEIDTQTVVEGKAAIAPATPVHEGYEFAGWQPSDFSNVTSNMTIVATYKAAAGSAIVTFKDEDETTVVETKSVKTGETVTPPDEPPTKEGHTLAAWLKDGEPYDFATPVTASFDLIASFTANVYTVTFQYEDGDVIDTQLVAYMQPATAPLTPAPKDPTQVFLKWDRDFSVIVEDTVVTALFLNQHTDVGTAADFLAYVAAGLPANATLTLTNDLDFTGLTFTPSNFAATLDGNGRSVTGLSTTPLFDVVAGTVKDLTIRDCDWTMMSVARFLADELHGATVSGCTLTNCTVSGRVFNAGIGGLAALACANEVGRGTVLSNCVARNCTLTYDERSGTIIGGLLRRAGKNTLCVDCAFETDERENFSLGGRSTAVGGIAGEAVCATFVRCRSNGRIRAGYSGSGSFVGGIVGYCASDQTNISSAPSVFVACTNAAEIMNIGVDGAAGGIVGRSEKTDICFEDCRNDGEITMDCAYANPQSKKDNAMGAGGIVGGVFSPISMSMARCVNYGSVSNGLGRIAGGLAGNLHSSGDGAELTTYVTNCVNHGGVTGGYAAGGLFGRHSGIVKADVVNCGNTGDVHCPTGHVGGVYGLANAVRKNNAQTVKLDDIRNVMNAGRVRTETGFAGGCIGTFVGSAEHEYKGETCGNNYTIAPTNLVLTTAVTAGESGVASNLIANIVLRGRTVTVADVNTHNLAPAGFTNGQAKRVLNNWVKAQEGDYPLWVQTKLWPDLAIFSKAHSGLVMFIY